MQQTKKHTTTKATSDDKGTVEAAALTLDQVFADDVKNAVLVVSLLINLALLIGYMVMQVTSAYDHQVISLLMTG